MIGFGHAVDSAGTDADRIFAVLAAGGNANGPNLKSYASKTGSTMASLAGDDALIAVDAFINIHDEKRLVEIHE
jgi:hypothetical protein